MKLSYLIFVAAICASSPCWSQALCNEIDVKSVLAKVFHRNNDLRQIVKSSKEEESRIRKICKTCDSDALWYASKGLSGVSLVIAANRFLTGSYGPAVAGAVILEVVTDELAGFLADKHMYQKFAADEEDEVRKKEMLSKIRPNKQQLENMRKVVKGMDSKGGADFVKDWLDLSIAKSTQVHHQLAAVRQKILADETKPDPSVLQKGIEKVNLETVRKMIILERLRQELAKIESERLTALIPALTAKCRGVQPLLVEGSPRRTLSAGRQ